MIKTTSFAPPRPPRKQRSSVRASGSPIAENLATTGRTKPNGISRSDVKILTSVRTPAPPDSPTIPVPAKSKSASTATSQEMTLSFDFEAPAPVVPVAPTPEVQTAPKAKVTKPKVAKAPAPEKVAALKVDAPKIVAPKVEPVKAIIEEVVEELAAPVVKKKAAPKAKRVRVPENLAEQYGAKLSKRVESGITDVPTEDAPKKRLNKAEREARKQLLRPDEGLLERLSRAANLIPAKKVAKPKGWKFDCGRCGRVSYFQTPNVDICVCGAIAVKD